MSFTDTATYILIYKKLPKCLKILDLRYSAVFNYMEQRYVIDFYNDNAQSFNNTRYCPWPIVKTFIDSLNPCSIVCDIGCGNGKNQYRKDIKFISCDNSFEMCNLVHEAILADCTQLPFENDTCDTLLCIAVIHHLSSVSRRILALQEMKRIMKPGSKALISVWGEHPKHGCGTQIIGWNKKENQRYIHFFQYDELKDLIQIVFDNFVIVEDFHNFFVFIN
jgi:SAM-dependent methyltransferase